MKALTDNDKELLGAAKENDSSEVARIIGEKSVNINCCEESDGMSPLMHAAFKGNADLVELLLAHGADPNSCHHKDQYTALMFATLSGSTETTRLLLEAGANVSAINRVKRTASQLGAFIGRHECVSMINNYVGQDTISYYSKKQGLEAEAKLPANLVGPVHQYILSPNLNPIKQCMFLHNHPELLENHEPVVRVLEMECSKAFKNVNEVFALKAHIYMCVLKRAAEWYQAKGEVLPFMKFLLKGRDEDGFPLNAEQLLRDSIRSFPYAQSNVFQQIVKTLSSIAVGTEPSALSVITQSINGMQSADFSESCVCCGERDSVKKCSKCKVARYCDAPCQKLHWSNHKRFCARLAEEFAEMKRREKEILDKEMEEAQEEEDKMKQQRQQQGEEGTDEGARITEIDGDSESKLEEIGRLAKADSMGDAEEKLKDLSLNGQERGES